MEAETQLILSSAIPEHVLEAQQQDRLLLDVRKRIHEGKAGDFTLDASGAVRFHGRLCVPQRSQSKRIYSKRHIVLDTLSTLVRIKCIRI